MSEHNIRKFTLFRFPMAHSFSPFIHGAFAEQFHITLEYTQTEVKPHHLQQAIAHFHQEGGIGANVTMPLKEEAFSLCGKVTSRCQQAQSTNTLYWQEDELWGDNTDGAGLITDINQNLQHSLQDKTICILGAGGAAAGILGAIAAQKPKAIIIGNRNFERAEILARRFEALTPDLQVLSFDEINDYAKTTPLDWIINTTPFSATSLLVPVQPHVFESSLIYELAYSKEANQSAFATLALKHGAKNVFDGIGMLVEQAAISFSVWHEGCFPETKSVIAGVRKRLQL